MTDPTSELSCGMVGQSPGASEAHTSEKVGGGKTSHDQGVRVCVNPPGWDPSRGPLEEGVSE